MDSTNAPRNNRLSNYSHAHSWSARRRVLLAYADQGGGGGGGGVPRVPGPVSSQ